MANEVEKKEEETAVVAAAPAPFASAEELLSFDDEDSEEVLVPVWGRTVRIRALTMAQAQQLRKDALKGDTKGGVVMDTTLYERKLLQLSLAEPELTDAQMDKLMLKSMLAISFLLKEINRINGNSLGAGQDMVLSFR